MRRIVYFLFCFGYLAAQDTTRVDSLVAPALDSLILRGTSLYISSKDSVDTPVDYGARDSIIFDMVNKLIHLYGEATIHYQTMDLAADYILIDMNGSLVDARPGRDSLGRVSGIPAFKDRDQRFTAQNIKYNFKSRRGLVTEAVSKETDVYVHGEKSKFYASDSISKNAVIYNQNGIFTTCDAPEPHFGIYSRRQKIIANKLIVVGPSIVKIHGVPAPPLMLPFGFFPISKNKTSGLIFPKNYVYDQSLGFGLQDIGYYFPLSDYYDLKVTGSIWFKGSFAVNAHSNYLKKYKYSGSLDLHQAFLSRELTDTYLKSNDQTFKIKWVHKQLPGAHPYRTFGGDIDLSLNPFDRLVYRDFNSYNKNILRSNINFAYNFPNSPFSITAGMSHDQNLQTRDFSITLPSGSLNMRPIHPFKRKTSASGQERWYEKLTVNYKTNFINRLITKDTLLLKPETLKNIQYGVQHAASMDLSFKVFKYISVVPQVSYGEEWLFKRQQFKFNPDTIISGGDTTYGKIDTTVYNKFGALRTLTSSLSANTQIYGQLLFRRGWLRGIRHVMSPGISMSYAPNYHRSPFNYFNSVSTDSRPMHDVVREYLIYTGSPFGTSGVPSENFVVSFNLTNRVEMKYYQRKDSTIKKFPLLENFSLGGNYNVFADSFKLSNITGLGRMSYFKGITSITFGMTFDPYVREITSSGQERRVNRFLFDQNKKLANLTDAMLVISNGTTIPKIISLVRGKQMVPGDVPEFGSLFNTFGLSHTMQYRFQRTPQGRDSFFLAVHSLSTSGYIELTPKWRVTIGQVGYDFIRHLPTYPQFGFERDLHCWTMKFDYYPQARSFTFFIGVKPGSLDFIKIPSNRNFTGGYY